LSRVSILFRETYWNSKCSTPAAREKRQGG
jgi:hypothetical protein